MSGAVLIPAATRTAIEEREAEVLGKPPRIAIGRAGKDLGQVRAATERPRHDLEPSWDALAAGLLAEQIFELLVLIGQFTTVAYFQNALRLPLEAGNADLATC